MSFSRLYTRPAISALVEGGGGVVSPLRDPDGDLALGRPPPVREETQDHVSAGNNTSAVVILRLTVCRR